MARIRTIKPEFWRDEELSSVSCEAALLAIGLLNVADDSGYFNANPKLIAAEVFPLRELCSSTTALMDELLMIGYIKVFSGSDGKRYGCICNFEKHQVINKKTSSKISKLCEIEIDYLATTVVLPSGKERKGKEEECKPSPSALPSDDAPKGKKESGSIIFDTFVTRCKERDEQMIPADDPVFDFAAKSKIPDDFLRLAWIEFRDRFKGTSKRYRDWRRVFRNAVRDNWYKIWWCDEHNNICLTNKGRMLKNTHMKEAA